MEKDGLYEQYFLTDIFILKCRHLRRIHIEIGKDIRRHLILTGKNGSGKSSVLEEIRDKLQDLTNEYSSATFQIHTSSLKAQLKISHQSLLKAKENSNLSLDDINLLENHISDNEFEQQAIDFGARFGARQRLGSVSLLGKNSENWLRKINFSATDQLVYGFIDYYEVPFVTAYIPAQRDFDFLKPQTEKSTQAFKFEEQGIREQANSQFIHYLMQKRIQQAFSSLNKNEDEVAEVENWFNIFESYLCSIFEISEIERNEFKFTFDSRNYYFDVKLPGREPVGLQQLSDGFKSIVYILSEILLRIEKIKTTISTHQNRRRSIPVSSHSEGIDNLFKKIMWYAEPENIQGIVIIDEIETHLHIALQKQILPFLTSFFPNIQFIVSSHSPYVLSSIDNAVVYDLENHNLINEPLVGFPAEAIVETHFEVDKFSNFLNQIKADYENLLSLEQPTKKDIQMLQKLRNQLQEMPKFRAAEIKILLAETKELYQAKISSYDKLS